MSCQRVRGRARAARLLLLGLALASTVVPGRAQAASEPRLLLLPIVVHSAEDPDYLRDGLNDMLTARLARIGSLELVPLPPKTDPRGTTQLELARAIGRRAGADFVLFGSFTRFGQGASLDVQCAPTDEGKALEPLREIFVHSGSIGEIIPDLDDLAGKVSRFARGENVSPAAPAAAPAPVLAGVNPVAIPNLEIEDLRDRIEALEAAFSLMLENDSAAGPDAELR